jgi:hypothetical protein
MLYSQSADSGAWAPDSAGRKWKPGTRELPKSRLWGMAHNALPIKIIQDKIASGSDMSRYRKIRHGKPKSVKIQSASGE